MSEPRVLVVDNYDSFVWTIIGYLRQLGAECTVSRNDEVALEQIDSYDAVLVSPGPGTPSRAGLSMATIRACAELEKPLLGVCLGHQALGEVFGATVSHAPQLRHGKTSAIHHNEQGLFAGLPNPLQAARYHSLAIETDTVPPELEVTAWTGSGVIMAVQHRQLPLYGVQFHPESVLTHGGFHMLAHWLTQCGSPGAAAAARALPATVHV